MFGILTTHIITHQWKWTALHTVAFYRGYNKQFTKEEYHERMRRITGILIEAGADPFARDRVSKL